MRCPLCGGELSEPWNNGDPWFCNPKRGGCGANVRGPLEVNARWCDRCGMYRDPHTHEDMPSLFDLEPNKQVRVEDPPTSVVAAKTLTKARVGTMRRNLLRVFERTTATAEEAAGAAGYGPETGAWKRVSDLLRDGFVEDTGKTRTASTGREQRVLRITDEGRAAL